MDISTWSTSPCPIFSFISKTFARPSCFQPSAPFSLPNHSEPIRSKLVCILYQQTTIQESFHNPVVEYSQHWTTPNALPLAAEGSINLQYMDMVCSQCTDVESDWHFVQKHLKETLPMTIPFCTCNQSKIVNEFSFRHFFRAALKILFYIEQAHKTSFSYRAFPLYASLQCSIIFSYAGKFSSDSKIGQQDSSEWHCIHSEKVFQGQSNLLLESVIHYCLSNMGFSESFESHIAVWCWVWA